MSKPASGTALNTGSSRYSSYTHAWALLEGSGTTSADSKGAVGLTLSSSGLWSTNGGGENIIHITAATASPLALGSAVALDGASSYTLAMKVKQATANDNGMVCGDNTNTNDFLWLHTTNLFSFRDSGNVNQDNITITAGDQTTTNIWFWVYTVTNAGLHLGTLQLFKGNTQVGTDFANFDGHLNITTIGNGYTSNTLALIGDIEAFYTFSAALGSSDRTALATDFYADFSGGTPLAAGSVAIVSNTDTSVVVSGAACTGGTATYSYQFQRSPDNGSNAPTGVWTNVGSPQSGLALATAPSNVTDSGRTASTKYWYRYAVTDSAGSPATANATAVSVTTYATATAYTLAAPSPASGPNGSASGNFTLTLTGYKGTTTSISLSVATITGSFTTSPVVLAAGNNSSGTFTFTPSSVGTGTVSASSGGALSDPSGVSYTSQSIVTLDLTTSISDNGTGTNPSAYIQVEGGAALGSHASVNSWAVIGAASGQSMSDGALRFKATITAIDLHVYANASPLSLFVDGIRKFTATLANSSAWATTSGLFTGLDGTAEHEYLLCWDTTAGMFVDKLILTGTANTAPLAARNLICFAGDSITQGTAGPTYSSLSWARQVGNVLNCQVANRGIGSTGIYYPGGAGNALVNRIADITGILPVPKIVHILDGVNDLTNGVSQGNFTTAYTTILTTVRAATGFSTTPVVCEAVLKQSSGDTSQNAMNGWISGLVTALADAHTVYRDGETTAYDGSAAAGNIHPNALGSPVVAVAGAVDLRPFLPVSAAAGAFSPIGCGFIRGV